MTIDELIIRKVQNCNNVNYYYEAKLSNGEITKLTSASWEDVEKELTELLKKINGKDGE